MVDSWSSGFSDHCQIRGGPSHGPSRGLGNLAQLIIHTDDSDGCVISKACPRLVFTVHRRGLEGKDIGQCYLLLSRWGRGARVRNDLL